MEAFDEWMDRIADPGRRARMDEIRDFLASRFPSLKIEIKWNQPMYTDHGTFIVSFAASKGHLSVAPERACLDRFEAEIARAGFSRTKEYWQIPWKSPVDWTLLEKMIEFNIADKAACGTFWRK